MGLWSRLVSHKEMISVVRLTLAISALSTIARSERDGKSLLSTFPFNQAEEGHGEHHGDHHGGHHGGHHGDHRVAYSESLQSGDSRQGYGGDQVRPQLRREVPHHLRHKLRVPAGGGVRGEL